MDKLEDNGDLTHPWETRRARLGTDDPERGPYMWLLRINPDMTHKFESNQITHLQNAIAEPKYFIGSITSPKLNES